jgi:hypothetical protein
MAVVIHTKVKRTWAPRCPQAVGECGRDEISEKGAAHQLQMTTHWRVCFRRNLQRDFLTCRSSRSRINTLQGAKIEKQIKETRFKRQIAL